MASLDARLIRALRSTNIHVPGVELARELGISQALLEERLVQLRAARYAIDEQPNLGYRLVSVPDRLIADDLHALLGETRLVRELVVLEETSSTNDLIAQLGRSGAREGIVVFAEHQRAGRGRLARRWDSATGQGLWFSLLLRPQLPLSEWVRLTTWAGVAVVTAIEEETGLRASLKWPNDIHVAAKKVVGILTETFVDQAAQPFAVVGIGINVNQTASDFPPELAHIAGSLREATGVRLDRPRLAAAVLRQLDRWYPALTLSFSSVVEEAARHSSLLGRWICAQSGSRVVEGIAERLDGAGALVVRDAEGREVTLAGGEVSIVRIESREA